MITVAIAYYPADKTPRKPWVIVSKFLDRQHAADWLRWEHGAPVSAHDLAAGDFVDDGPGGNGDTYRFSAYLGD